MPGRAGGLYRRRLSARPCLAPVLAWIDRRLRLLVGARLRASASLPLHVLGPASPEIGGTQQGMRCDVRLWVWPVVALLGCGPSAPAPLHPPPGGSAVSSAEPEAPLPAPSEAERGAVSVYIDLAPFSGSDPRCRTTEAGDEAWVELSLSGGAEPVAKARSGEVVELAPGDYRARSFRRDGEKTRGGTIHDVYVASGATERLAFRFNVRCDPEHLETAGEALPASEVPLEPPECRVALDCMLDAQGLPRPVRNAAERAARARFRPCETGESTAGCRAGRCVPMHYGC